MSEIPFTLAPFPPFFDLFQPLSRQSDRGRDLSDSEISSLEEEISSLEKGIASLEEVRGGTLPDDLGKAKPMYDAAFDRAVELTDAVLDDRSEDIADDLLDRIVEDYHAARQ